MAYADDKRLHDTINFVGLRAQATVVGLLQLVRELQRSGAIDEDAVGRIKEAIAADLSLDRPRSGPPEEFDRKLRERLDNLFAGEERVGTGDVGAPGPPDDGGAIGWTRVIADRDRAESC